MALNKCTSIYWCDGRPTEKNPDKHFTKCNGFEGHETSHTGECPEFGWVRYWTDTDRDTDLTPPSKPQWVAWIQPEGGSWAMVGPFDTKDEALAVRELAYFGTVYSLRSARIEVETVETKQLVIE